jgi:chemotaxis protein methyltransferase CheR
MLKIPLTDTTFKNIRDYIYEKSGIYISDTKKYLIENRLSRILQEKSINSFEEYFKLISFNSNGHELSRLFDAVTTNETYFFRESHQLTTLVEEVLPWIRNSKNGSNQLKVWSAACSTGEEPYTISMMLMEKSLSPGSFEIHASDISEGVLASAKRAVYNSYSVRNIPDRYMKKYFAPAGKDFNLNAKVKATVNFRKLNLIEDRNDKSIKGIDVVFCRNVLIYFDTRAKQKVVSNLYDSLNPGGYLIIGSSESLHNITRAFRPCVINKVILYQKI